MRFHENFQHIPLSVFKNGDIGELSSVKFHQYHYSDQNLKDIKWGILLNSSNEFLELLDILKLKGKRVDQVKHADLSIGQGLNLNKCYFIQKNDLHRLNIPQKSLIPFVTSYEGAPFNIYNTDYYLIDKGKLAKHENSKLSSIKLFDRNKTRKIVPALILPRGIGRHFCAINSISAFSASFVEIYKTSRKPTESVLNNLWLFLNSSIAWLIREMSGRKNLGGGMLKAEAVDLKYFPIYFDFDNNEKIKSILKDLSQREALETTLEIETSEHKCIDDIVFSFLGIDSGMKNKLIDLLKSKIIERTKKSKT